MIMVLFSYILWTSFLFPTSLVLGICNSSNCINGMCNAMGYCVCMPGFTGEKCDMRKRGFFVFFEYTQYA